MAVAGSSAVSHDAPAPASESQPQEGAVVAGDVRLVEQIGTGASASVWLGYRDGIEAPVAVKLFSERLASQEARERFVREARLLSRVRTPTVVRLLDAGTEGETPFLLLEYVEGETLSTRLARCGALTVAETGAILEQLFATVSALHRAGIVHRDIKPSNIMVRGEGDELKITLLDFGIAKDRRSPSLTEEGCTLGTPHYMSPERLFGTADADGTGDLWAAAVVAYECLTGRTPYDGKTFGAICVSVHAGRFPPVSELRPAVPAAIDTWFLRALSPTLKARFATAEAMADSFRQALFERRAPSMPETLVPPPFGVSSSAPTNGITSVGGTVRPPPSGTSTVPPPPASGAMAVSRFQTAKLRLEAPRSDEDVVDLRTTRRYDNRAFTGPAVLPSIVASILLALLGFMAWAQAANAAPRPGATPSVRIVP